MAAHPVPRHRLQAALDAVAGGTSLRDAAEAAGISFATLKRYRAAAKHPGAVPSKPSRVTATGGASSPGAAKVRHIPSPRAREPKAPSDARLPSSAVLGALEAGDEADETLLQVLRAELRHAHRARRKATSEDKPGAEAKWSKRIEELVKAVERLEPPPPPPPNLVQDELRRLDAEAIALIEQHLADKLDPKEIAA